MEKGKKKIKCLWHESENGKKTKRGSISTVQQKIYQCYQTKEEEESELSW